MKDSELQNILDRVHSWITSADQKISIFLAFQGVVLTWIFPYFVQRLFDLDSRNCLILLLVSCFVVSGWGVFYSIAGIIPRIRNKGKRSLTFFGDIAALEYKDYKVSLANLAPDQYKDETVSQIHISSLIATRKHICLRRAIILFWLGLIMFALNYILLNYGLQ